MWKHHTDSTTIQGGSWSFEHNLGNHCWWSETSSAPKWGASPLWPSLSPILCATNFFTTTNFHFPPGEAQGQEVTLPLWDQCSVRSRSLWWWGCSLSTCRSHSRGWGWRRRAGWGRRRWTWRRLDRSRARSAFVADRRCRRWRRAWWRRRWGSRRWNRRDVRSCRSMAGGRRGRRRRWRRPAWGSPSPDTWGSATGGSPPRCRWREARSAPQQVQPPLCRARRWRWPGCPPSRSPGRSSRSSGLPPSSQGPASANTERKICHKNTKKAI